MGGLAPPTLCRILSLYGKIVDRRASFISTGYCKKDVTPLLTHWSYVFLALIRRSDVESMDPADPVWSEGLCPIQVLHVSYLKPRHILTLATPYLWVSLAKPRGCFNMKILPYQYRDSLYGMPEQIEDGLIFFIRIPIPIGAIIRVQCSVTLNTTLQWLVEHKSYLNTQMTPLWYLTHKGVKSKYFGEN